MALLSKKQKTQIISLLRQGKLEREQIAQKVGVSPGTVSAIKAHITMGTYDDAYVSEEETNELVNAAETTFGIERDLQRALRENICQLDPELQIIDDGKEYVTDAGRIDILAEDRSGAVVVIELKAGVASPDALTQLLAYMGAVSRQQGKKIRGILVAADFHPRVIFAARVVPDVALRRYRFTFRFETVE